MSREVSTADERSPRSIDPRRGTLEAGAFESLFRECAADVHAYTISLLGDRSAAEDATALAFERLYRSCPSARLGAALAALGALAPVRAQSQSLQDITDAYDAARQRLTDAMAEQRALLRALSRATTQGQIDSLRERLSQARSAIAQARSGLAAAVLVPLALLLAALTGGGRAWRRYRRERVLGGS